MQINTINGEKITFEVHEGSNYLFIDTYGEEQVVLFKDFQKIMQNLIHTDADLVTINDEIWNRRYIRKIKPTKLLTTKEQESNLEKQRLRAKEELENQEQVRRFDAFRAEWMNKKFGRGNWIRKDLLKNSEEIIKDYNH